MDKVDQATGLASAHEKSADNMPGRLDAEEKVKQLEKQVKELEMKNKIARDALATSQRKCKEVQASCDHERRRAMLAEQTLEMIDHRMTHALHSVEVYKQKAESLCATLERAQQQQQASSGKSQ